MRILLVEDEVVQLETLQRALRNVPCELLWERSSDSAIRRLKSERELDLVICDLKIPTEDGQLDVSEEHGFRVHDFVRTEHPGTPTAFLSVWVSLRNVGRRLALGVSGDLYGSGATWPLVEVFEKDELPKLIQFITQIGNELEALESIALEGDVADSMSIHQARLLRIYARRLGGSRIVVRSLGGLSGAVVAQAAIVNHAGETLGLVVAKINGFSVVGDEIRRYKKWVAPLLGPGAFVDLVEEVGLGAGRNAVAIYRLAGAWRHDLLQFVIDAPDAARPLVQRLREILMPWDQIEQRTQGTVGELRASRVGDDQIEAYEGSLQRIGWQEAESRAIAFRRTVQHGDLHGLNVLVNDRSEPMVIDYANVGMDPACCDPVTLELSLIFHRDRPSLGWPTIEQALRWFDLDAYLVGCPVSDLTRECREWALATVDDPAEIAAMTYAHAMRQLKYSDTNKDLVMAVVASAVEELLSE